MSEEKAKENANPLSAFKGLRKTFQELIDLSVKGNGMSCGARGRDDDNQRLLMASREGR